MPRPRNPDAKPLLLAGERACNFTVRLPIGLALKIEDHLHAEMRRNIIQKGSRAEASVASLFRAAIEHYLECPQATSAEIPRSRRPPKVKGAEVTHMTPKASARPTRKKR